MTSTVLYEALINIGASSSIANAAANVTVVALAFPRSGYVDA